MNYYNIIIAICIILIIILIIVIIVLYFTVNSDDFKKYAIISASISAVLMFIAIIVKLVDKFFVKKDKTEEEEKPIQPSQPTQLFTNNNTSDADTIKNYKDVLKDIKAHITIYNEIKNLMYKHRNIIKMQEDDEALMNRNSPKCYDSMFRMTIDKTIGTYELIEPLTASDSLIEKDNKYKNIYDIELYKELNKNEKYRNQIRLIFAFLHGGKASYNFHLWNILEKYQNKINSIIPEYTEFIRRMHNYIDAWNNFIKAVNNKNKPSNNNDMIDYEKVKKEYDPSKLYNEYGEWKYVNPDGTYPYIILERPSHLVSTHKGYKSGIDWYNTLIKDYPAIYRDKYISTIDQKIGALMSILVVLNPPL